jgi:hypothetical protein
MLSVSEIEKSRGVVESRPVCLDLDPTDRYLPSFDGPMTPMTIGELEFIKIISVE